MSLAISSLSTAVNALRVQFQRVERAAESISDAGLTDPAPPGADPSAAPDSPPAGGMPDLADGMVTMLIAQRAVAAQLRVIRAVDEMSREAMKPSGSGR